MPNDNRFHSPRDRNLSIPPGPKISSDLVKKWIQTGMDREAISFSEEFGKYLAELEYTTSQIRNVFGELRRIQLGGIESQVSSFHLLKAKIAYTTRKDKAPTDKQFAASGKFKELFDAAHDAVDLDNHARVHFNHFVNLMESILAYHKAHGGK